MKRYTVTITIEEVTEAEREWKGNSYVEKTPRRVQDVVRVVSSSPDGTEQGLDHAIGKAVALLQVQAG